VIRPVLLDVAGFGEFLKEVRLKIPNKFFYLGKAFL